MINLQRTQTLMASKEKLFLMAVYEKFLMM